jgi:hypothetical protein
LIGELERYHGVALVRLVRGAASHGQTPMLASRGRSAYVVNDRVGLYMKYSTNRLSPWAFSFSRSHQQELEALASEYETAFLVLVCGQDGVACLTRTELARILNDDYQNVEWVKASRRARQKYLITGSDNRHGFKVADSEFPSKVFAALSTSV